MAKVSYWGQKRWLEGISTVNPQQLAKRHCGQCGRSVRWRWRKELMGGEMAGIASWLLLVVVVGCGEGR